MSESLSYPFVFLFFLLAQTNQHIPTECFSMCMCFKVYYYHPVILLFNEIVINAHTWRAQLNYNIPCTRSIDIPNEKQFLMWRQTMTSILDVRTWIRFRNINWYVHYTRGTLSNFLPNAYIFGDISTHRHTLSQSQAYVKNKMNTSSIFKQCVCVCVYALFIV